MLLSLDMSVSISDEPRVYAVRAVLARKCLRIFIKRQTLSLEPTKGAIPSGVHDVR